MRRNELRGMTGGDFSNSSEEIGYLHKRHQLGFALSLVLFLSCSVGLLLLLSRCLFMFMSLLVGPHPPNG
jgi:hypothetical protein